MLMTILLTCNKSKVHLGDHTRIERVHGRHAASARMTWSGSTKAGPPAIADIVDVVLP